MISTALTTQLSLFTKSIMNVYIISSKLFQNVRGCRLVLSVRPLSSIDSLNSSTHSAQLIYTFSMQKHSKRHSLIEPYVTVILQLREHNTNGTRVSKFSSKCLEILATFIKVYNCIYIFLFFHFAKHKEN